MAKKKTTATKSSPKAAPEPKVTQEPVVVRIQRTTKRKPSGEEATEEGTADQVNLDGSAEDLDIIEVRRFITEPALVNYNYGISRSVNYQTVTLGVSITLPCYREEIEDGVEEAKQIVLGILKEENKKLTGVLEALVSLRTKAEQELARKGLA